MDPKFVLPGHGLDSLPGARIDFRALVAFLAASQAVQPNSRIAARIAERGDRLPAQREVLIALFAPQRRRDRLARRPDSAILQGRFNAAVPNGDGALTGSQPW